MWRTQDNAPFVLFILHIRQCMMTLQTHSFIPKYSLELLSLPSLAVFKTVLYIVPNFNGDQNDSTKKEVVIHGKNPKNRGRKIMQKPRKLIYSMYLGTDWMTTLLVTRLDQPQEVLEFSHHVYHWQCSRENSKGAKKNLSKATWCLERAERKRKNKNMCRSVVVWSDSNLANVLAGDMGHDLDDVLLT